jgi:hypothetical protein
VKRAGDVRKQLALEGLGRDIGAMVPLVRVAIAGPPIIDFVGGHDLVFRLLQFHHLVARANDFVGATAGDGRPVGRDRLSTEKLSKFFATPID